jgi:hypothetical protein
MTPTDLEQLLGADGSPMLAEAAQRLRAEPRVIAGALAAYQAQQAWSEATLAAWLDLSVPRLHALALCRRPDLNAIDATRAVAEIVAAIGCDPVRLRIVLDATSPAGPA